VKCVKEETKQISLAADFSAMPCLPYCLDCKHAKTPLKHVDTSRRAKQPCETIIARRLLNDSTRTTLVSTHHLHTNALLHPPVYITEGSLFILGPSLLYPNNPAITLNHPSSPPDSITSRRILTSKRRGCSSTSAVCLLPSHQQYDEDWIRWPSQWQWL